MKTFGNQLLARPALADDEHGPVERRRAAASLDRVEEGEALPDELIRPLHDLSTNNLTDCWWQIPPFGKDFRCFFRGKMPFFPELRENATSGTALE